MRLARLFKAFGPLSQHIGGNSLSQRWLTRWSGSSFQSKFFIVFIISYLLAWVFLRWHVSHDPGSYFFTVRGYEPRYSLTRAQQAQAFLDSLENSTQAAALTVHQSSDKQKVPELCVGLPTARRPKEQYVNIALASLLDRLAPEEREQIQLNILIAQATPEQHPFFDEGGTSGASIARLADNVLTYHNVSGGSQALADRIHELEESNRYNEKSYYDYALILRQCHQSQAPWVLVLEDDTLAQAAWYARTMDALRQLDRKTRNSAGERTEDWLYLRLFYTEKFLGWNSEDWQTYLFWSLVAVLLTAGIGLYLRRLSSSSSSSSSLFFSSSASLPYTALPSDQSMPASTKKRALSLLFIFCISFLCVPALIILYFAAGRMTVQPLPRGVTVMNNFGCCSQALVFPRDMSLTLLNWLEKDTNTANSESSRDRRLPGAPVDSSIENYANERNLQRYALVPSAFQHVGAETVKEGITEAHDWFNISGARGIWNFDFEELDSWA